jgi:hypothetical protein
VSHRIHVSIEVRLITTPPDHVLRVKTLEVVLCLLTTVNHGFSETVVGSLEAKRDAASS